MEAGQNVGHRSYCPWSSGFTMIMAEQAAEQLLAVDSADGAGGRLGRRLPPVGQGYVAERLVGPQRVVVSHVRVHDVIEVAEAEAEEVVQGLAFEAADPRFGERVGDRRADRRLDDLLAAEIPE